MVFLYVDLAETQTKPETQTILYQPLVGSKHLDSAVYILKYEGKTYLITTGGHIIEHKK